MSLQYDEMAGEEMDAKSHPAQNVPQATQHYAGDVVAIPMGIGTMANAIMGNVNNNISQNSSKALDRTNVVPIPKKPK